MNLNEAFVKSIRSYFDGTAFEEMQSSTNQKLKYTKDYFDMIEKEFNLDEHKASDEEDLKEKE